MRVGVSLLFQDYEDWDRFKGGNLSQAPAVTDQQIYEEELRLASLIEPLGFDSIWAPEHHFGPFCETANVLHLMAYFAGAPNGSTREHGGRAAVARPPPSR